MDTYEAVIAIDESDDLSYRVEAMQELIDSGLAWTLQGRVGREAMAAIESGHCLLGPESRRDYWGNRVPSRFEVEPGTVGSIEYARERGYMTKHEKHDEPDPDCSDCQERSAGQWEDAMRPY